MLKLIKLTYKDKNTYKAANKTVLNDHLHKVNYSIAPIQDNYSELIDNAINRNSGLRSISNISAALETLSFVTISNMLENSIPMKNEQSS